MNWFHRIVASLSHSVHAPYATRLFSILIYVWLLGQALAIWPYHEVLWGSDSVLLRSARPSGLINNFVYYLIYNPKNFIWVYGLHVCSVVISLFEFRTVFLARIVAWLTGLMIYLSAYQAFDGGMIYMSLFAFYSIGIYTKAISPYRIVWSNLARWAMMIQVVMIYLFACIYKLSGAHWLTGDAIYYVLNIDFYSSPFWKKIADYSWLSKGLSFVVLGYQAIFPLMIGWKKKRNGLLLLGVSIHLMIGVVMHLWAFATAMMFCYALFMKEEHAKFLMPFRTLRKSG